jgi:hypothetical protein
MDDRFSRHPEDAIDCREQLSEREREWCRGRRDLLREIRTRESTASSLAKSLEDVDDFAHLLVLEEAPDELRARIFPRVVELVPRE